jgi:hypothetical protein
LRMLAADARFANLDSVLVKYRQQSTRRNPQHWRFNLRARTSNFGSRSIFRRSLGITFVAGWLVVPEPLREPIFRWLLLKRG